jgi:hypothetical protein
VSRFCCAVLLGVIVLLGSGCQSRLAPRVTCDGIRALKLGMSEPEVTRLLGGPPVRRGPLVGREDGHGQIVPAEKDTPILWQYDSGPGLFGPELEVAFVESKLTEVSVTFRPFPRSLGDIADGKPISLFRLPGTEKPEFAKQLGCQ